MKRVPFVELLHNDHPLFREPLAGVFNSAHLQLLSERVMFFGDTNALHMIRDNVDIAGQREMLQSELRLFNRDEKDIVIARARRQGLLLAKPNPRRRWTPSGVFS